MKKKILIAFVALLSVVWLAFGLMACRVESGGSGGILGGNSGSSANGGNSKNEYSEAMQSYLNRRAYYTSVVENYDNYSFSDKYNIFPLPLNYMKNDGVNFDVVKQNKYDVMCTPYFYNDDHNTLYVSAKIEQPSSAKEGNYYVNYLFKFSITDKEYKELSSLLEDHNCNAGFLVQEMERLGRMKVVSKAKFVKTAYKDMADSCQHSPNLNPTRLPQADFDIISIDSNLNITVSIRGVDKKATYNSGIGILNLYYRKNGGVHLYNGDVLNFYSMTSFYLQEKDMTDYYESYKTIKCYTPSPERDKYLDLNCLK